MSGVPVNHYSMSEEQYQMWGNEGVQTTHTVPYQPTDQMRHSPTDSERSGNSENTYESQEFNYLQQNAEEEEELSLDFAGFGSKLPKSDYVRSLIASTSINDNSIRCLKYEAALKVLREHGKDGAPIKVRQLAEAKHIRSDLLYDVCRFLEHFGGIGVKKREWVLNEEFPFDLLEARRETNRELNLLENEEKRLDDLIESLQKTYQFAKVNPYAYVTREDLDLRGDPVLLAKTSKAKVTTAENQVKVSNAKEVVMMKGEQLTRTHFPQEALTIIHRKDYLSAGQIIDRNEGFKRPNRKEIVQAAPVRTELNQYDLAALRKIFHMNINFQVNDGRSLCQLLLDKGTDPEFIRLIEPYSRPALIENDTKTDRKKLEKREKDRQRRERNRLQKQASGLSLPPRKRKEQPEGTQTKKRIENEFPTPYNAKKKSISQKNTSKENFLKGDVQGFTDSQNIVPEPFTGSQTYPTGSNYFSNDWQEMNHFTPMNSSNENFNPPFTPNGVQMKSPTKLFSGQSTQQTFNQQQWNLDFDFHNDPLQNIHKNNNHHQQQYSWDTDSISDNSQTQEYAPINFTNPQSNDITPIEDDYENFDPDASIDLGFLEEGLKI